MNTSSGTNYKGIAREKLLGRYSTIIGAILVMQLIFCIVSYITDRVVDDSTIAGMIMYTAIAVIVGLIGAVFTVGELTMYMKLACGDEIRIRDIFSGFTGHPDKAIIIQFKIAVRCLIFLLPAIVIFGYTYYVSGGVKFTEGGGIAFDDTALTGAGTPYILLTVLAVIAGFTGAIYVRLKYAQCFYLMIDHPEYEAADVLDKSATIMKGHMWDYLYINLSFIPIMILGVLSLGVGLMYIQPYRGMTLTEYYMALASGEHNRGRNIDLIIDDELTDSDDIKKGDSI